MQCLNAKKYLKTVVFMWASKLGRRPARGRWGEGGEKCVYGCVVRSRKFGERDGGREGGRGDEG